MPIVKVSYHADRPWHSVQLPGSKSIAARAMIARYVYGHGTMLQGMPDCDDTRQLHAALEVLAQHCPDALQRIREYGEVAPATLPFNLGNGGTSLRFFLALAASLPGLVAEIDCGEELRMRPLAPLIEGLRRHGADIECLHREGYAPLLVRGRRLHGGPAMIDGSVSSQFLSALMLASPLWDSPLITDDIRGMVSKPYVTMTQGVMKAMADAPDSYRIETDWSAASYFYELALAVPEREIIIESLTDPAVSLQGDAACQGMFGWTGVRTERMDESSDGAVRIVGDHDAIAQMRGLKAPVEFDLADTPDLTPALAAGLCLARLPFRFSGIGHLRHKECDRLTALSTELGKAGYAVHDYPDALEWQEGLYPTSEDETFCAYHDHRMAMSLAILSVRLRHIGIEEGNAVTKSFPGYYNQLRRLGFDVSAPVFRTL